MPGFLAPLFMFGALAAAVPIVLHLLKREPEARVRFAAVKLLQLAPVEQSARRRLREWLLLALRVTAILLLSLAFARPFLAGDVEAESAGVVVVALDTSFSLSTPERFGRAQELARSAVRQAPPDALVAVVTFADDAEVAAVPTRDRARALAAIDRAQAGFGATRYRQAFLAAAGLITERGESDGTIVMVTDAQEVGWAPDDGVAIPEAVRLELADVGPLVPNLAVTDVLVASGRIAATVRNLSPEAREARVHVLVDEVMAGEASVSIGPNQAGSVALPVGESGARAEVRVEDPGGLQADNARYIVLKGRSATPVLVVTANGDLEREAFFVQQALLAVGPSGAAYAVEGVSAAALADWPVTRLHDYAAVTLLSTQGLDRRGRDVIREYAMRGGRLLVVAGPGVDGDVVGALGREIEVAVPADAPADPRSERRTLTPVDVRHPVFRSLGAAGGTLGLVTFRRVASVGAPGCDLLARFTTGEAALVECTADGSRTLVFASDLNQAWNDFPRHGLFVPFLHEVVNYLSEGRRWASEYRVADMPTGIDPAPGFVTLPSGRAEGQPRVVAVNVDPEESNPARLTEEAFVAAVTRPASVPADGAPAVTRQEPSGQQAWRYLLWLMFGVLIAESVLGRRTA